METQCYVCGKTFDCVSPHDDFRRRVCDNCQIEIDEFMNDMAIETKLKQESEVE